MHELSFATVDDLAFAAERGKLPNANDISFEANDLGPALELVHLASSHRELCSLVESSVKRGTVSEIVHILLQGHRSWFCDTQRKGFLRIRERQGETPSARFGIAAHRAALAAGFPKTSTRQLIGALLEMHGNILEHSGAINTGVIAFQVRDGLFEFVVSDRGEGMLRTLRANPELSHIIEHRDALRLALADGVTRYSNTPDRGQGFRPLFLGLAGLNGNLRFRSGDAALHISGKNLVLENHKTMQKAPISGFLASVTCQLQ